MFAFLQLSYSSGRVQHAFLLLYKNGEWFSFDGGKLFHRNMRGIILYAGIVYLKQYL